MENDTLVPFKSEPIGPNVEYLIRISCFNEKEDYCYSGPFQLHLSYCDVYLPLVGSAFSVVGPGIFGFTESKGAYFKIVMEKPDYIMRKYGRNLRFKFQVFAALKRELRVDTGNLMLKSAYPEIYPNGEGEAPFEEEPYSYSADRVWICKSFDDLDKAKFHHWMKRKVQFATFGANHGH